VIKELHKGSYSIKNIMEIEEIPHFTVCNTFKLFTTRPKGHSLYLFECLHTLTKGKKHSIIHFYCENIKTTYTKVKQQLLLNCSLKTIYRIVQKQRIKK
jgi:hypothetical protein